MPAEEVDGRLRPWKRRLYLVTLAVPAASAGALIGAFRDW